MQYILDIRKPNKHRLSILLMDKKAKNYWLTDIIAAIRDLGNCATLPDIYRWIQRNRSNFPTEYKAVVRATIYSNSKDACAYVSGNPDVFQKVSRGEWALRYPKDDIPTHKMSENEWLLHEIRKVTRDELQAYSGRGDALLEKLHKRVQNARARYHMDSG